MTFRSNGSLTNGSQRQGKFGGSAVAGDFSVGNGKRSLPITKYFTHFEREGGQARAAVFFMGESG